MTLFSMKSLEDNPANELFSTDLAAADSLKRRSVLIKAADQIVEKFTDLSYCQGKEKKRAKGSSQQPKESSHHDGVQAYASEVLNLGLIFMEFIDGVREGDGNRILTCWKYFLLLFKSNKRKNYAIEALNLHLQFNFTLSPRMAAQLKWSRTINIHNKPGRNVSSDLHMEHLNRVAKVALYQGWVQMLPISL